MGWVSAGLGIISAITGRKDAKRQAAAEGQAAQQSMAGFDYLKGSDSVNQAQQFGSNAGGIAAGLLGTGGDQAQSEAAFQQYQDSTGYNFRKEQGMSAITGSAAANGLLNSGATLKGLTDFGQNLASSEFGNYLGQLQGQEAQGLNAAYNVASQGQAGGMAAAGHTTAAAAHRTEGSNQMMGGLATAAGGLADMWQNRKGVA